MNEPTIEKPLPHNPEAERSVLGAVLISSKAFEELDLQSGDFFFDSNRRIFLAMSKLAENGQAIDLVPLIDLLETSGEIEAAGGAAYVASLANGLPRVANIGQYARIVRQKALLRKLIHHTHAVQTLALEGSSEPEVLLDSEIQALMELALESSTTKGETKTYREASMSLLKSFDERSMIRMFIGLTKLDSVTGGFQSGELITITAGTGVGKTLLASQMRKISCDRGNHSLYCSGEMSAEHLTSRELATEAEVSHWKMRQPEQIIKEEMAALVVASGRQCHSGCQILDGELSLQKIRMSARRQKRVGKLHCVIVDYDELVDSPGRTELDQQRNLVRGLKSLAVELQVPVVIISQLRKSLNPEDAKKPTLERLYGSGAKSKHTSIVLYVDREWVRELAGDETDGKVYVLKSRDGRLCVVDVKFNLKTLRFDDAPEFGDMPAETPRRRKSKIEREE